VFYLTAEIQLNYLELKEDIIEVIIKEDEYSTGETRGMKVGRQGGTAV
jgi:hypothetical protein